MRHPVVNTALTFCDEYGIMPMGASDLDVTKQLLGREIEDRAKSKDDCRLKCMNANKKITGCTHAWFMKVQPHFVAKVWNKAGGNYVYHGNTCCRVFRRRVQN